MRLSVVVPARNEGGNIGPFLRRLRGRLDAEGLDYEVVVVDDGSTDGTAGEAQAAAHGDSRVVVLANPGPHGFGYAVRHGLEVFGGDAVAIMMGDGSDDPEDLVRYFYVLRDRAECAFGSRFVPGGIVENYPRLKLVVNRLANTFVRLLFGLAYNDVTNAFKGYRAEVIAGCRPFLSAHFNLTVELPLKAIVRGYSYEVMPIGWRQRDNGMSALRLREMGSRYLFVVLHVWLEKMLALGDYRRRESHGTCPTEDMSPAERPVPTKAEPPPGMERTDRLYRYRFSDVQRRRKERVWEVLCRAFFQRYVRETDTVLDLGCGFGEFIRYISARRRIAIDANPQVASLMPAGVEFHLGEGGQLGFIESESVDVCFSSNFFEHLPSKSTLDAVLVEIRRLLRPHGVLLAMGPNIKYAPGDYWDFYDHHLPLSHLSCAEAFAKAGLEVREVIGRFLPLSTGSPLPKHPALVRGYLVIRPAWRLFGRQFLVVGRKPAIPDADRA